MLDTEIAGHGVHGDEWLVEPFVQASNRLYKAVRQRQACLTLRSAYTMFPVVEDFALGVATGGGEQVENVLQEFADSLTKVCCSHATAGAVTGAANFVELKVRARWTPFRSQHETPRLAK